MSETVNMGAELPASGVRALDAILARFGDRIERVELSVGMGQSQYTLVVDMAPTVSNGSAA